MNSIFMALNKIFILWNPLSWAAEKIKTSVASFLYSFLVYLASIIYSFISYVYRVFLYLAGDSHIFDDTLMNGFIKRIYVILGVVVLFLVAYSLLKAMVNPDEALKGKKSPVHIIRDVIISIILIALIPSIFDFAYDFQDSLLRNNTIGKIVVGSSGESPNTTIAQGGYTMASEVWKAFIIVNEGYCDADDVYDIDENSKDAKGTVKGTGEECTILVNEDGNNYKKIWQNAQDSSTFWELSSISEFISDGHVTYVFLLDLFAGFYVLYVLMVYCFEMAVRVVKLNVYELIAPLPIFARILPNEQGSKFFNNWVKACLSTFLEVFIRIAILYFCVLLISNIGISLDDFFTSSVRLFSVASIGVGELFKSLFISSSSALFVSVVAKALLVLGVVRFIQEAPGIIKDLTGLDGNKYGKALMQGAGMLASSIGGGVTTTLRSFANDKDKPMPNRLWRAAKAGLNANARGVWNGRKVEKFGDIPKTAGKAASNTLERRAKQEAAGGFWAFKRDQVEATKAKVGNWLSSEDNSRIQELGSKLDADVTSAQSVYKKTQAYIDAKAETEKLKNKTAFYESAFKDELNKICQMHNIDYEKASDQDKDAIEKLANEELMRKKGVDYLSIKNAFEESKSNQKAIEESEMVKKSDVVASAARDFAFQLSNYSDIGLDVEKAIRSSFNNDEEGRKEAQKIVEAFNKYKDLEPEDLADRIKADLKDSNTVEQVQKYVDAMDKITNEAKSMQSRAAFKETVYKSKVNNASNNDKKK